MRDVVLPGFPAGPGLPVHPVRGGLGDAREGLGGQQRQLDVADLEGGERDPGIAAEQLDEQVPASPVEALGHHGERLAGGSCCCGVAQFPADGVQGEGHAGQPEVERVDGPAVSRGGGDERGVGHGGGEAPGAAQGGVAVAVVPEVPACFEQRQHHARGAAVEGGVEFALGRPGGPGEPVAVGAPRCVQQPVEGARRGCFRLIHSDDRHAVKIRTSVEGWGQPVRVRPPGAASPSEPGRVNSCDPAARARPSRPAAPASE